MDNQKEVTQSCENKFPGENITDLPHDMPQEMNVDPEPNLLVSAEQSTSTQTTLKSSQDQSPIPVELSKLKLQELEQIAFFNSLQICARVYFEATNLLPPELLTPPSSPPVISETDLSISHEVTNSLLEPREQSTSTSAPLVSQNLIRPSSATQPHTGVIVEPAELEEHATNVVTSVSLIETHSTSSQITTNSTSTTSSSCLPTLAGDIHSQGVAKLNNEATSPSVITETDLPMPYEVTNILLESREQSTSASMDSQNLTRPPSFVTQQHTGVMDEPAGLEGQAMMYDEVINVLPSQSLIEDITNSIASQITTDSTVKFQGGDAKVYHQATNVLDSVSNDMVCNEAIDSSSTESESSTNSRPESPTEVVEDASNTFQDQPEIDLPTTTSSGERPTISASMTIREPAISSLQSQACGYQEGSGHLTNRFRSQNFQQGASNEEFDNSSTLSKLNKTSQSRMPLILAFFIGFLVAWYFFSWSHQ